MQLVPVHTRVLVPPKDDLQAVLALALPPLYDGDVLCLSSKVVAIHEGRTVAMDIAKKQELVETESSFSIPRPYWPSPLHVRDHAFLGAAGVDESNGNGYYVLLPEDSFRSAEKLYTWFTATYGLTHGGVVIVDSHSVPFRYGATGIALGWHGIVPLEDCRGKEDIFGRSLQYERSNIVDGLAAAATVVMGETNEQIPAVVVRDIPRLTYTKERTRDQIFVPFREDTFRVLYEQYLPKE